MSVTAPPPSVSDQLLSRVINFVGLLAIAALVGIVVLAVLERPVPDILQMIATGALTGLVGLLAGRKG